MAKATTKEAITRQIQAAKAQTETVPTVATNDTIPISKILALKIKNPNISSRQIGKILNRSHTSINRRLEPYKEELEGLQEFKSNRGDMLAMVQSKLLNSVSVDDIKDASLLQKLSAFGILYDKERLETGQSTTNTSVLATVVQGIHEKL